MKSRNGSGADEVVTVGRCSRLSRVLIAIVAALSSVIFSCQLAPTQTRPTYQLAQSPSHPISIGVRPNFFRGGWAIFAPKIFWQPPKKTAMLTCRITLPDLPHPVIISKNPGHFFLARQNDFRFFSFNKYKMYFFLAFGCWLLPEK